MFKQEQGALPVSQPGGGGGEGIRKRLSSLYSVQTPTTLISSSASSLGAAFRRSKSMGDVEYMRAKAADGFVSIRRWWDWGWSWILSRKPTFAKDLEMNEDEKAALGCHSKGSWRHVFYKVKFELRRRLMGSEGLPQTFRYDSLDYSKNFDDQTRRTFSHHRHFSR
ncbi:uncharacterized protein LOC116028832 [Ipomoea triloba]|uniref:uncharacterized protein LOC116028832 n=1 Tax=Ipomoea triloba TaxID=35885 RepID=UPI00125DBC67|nr:uncharacterized protein LOC116028832 [Ipomoea triloba]